MKTLNELFGNPGHGADETTLSELGDETLRTAESEALDAYGATE